MLGFGLVVVGIAEPATGGAAPSANALQGAQISLQQLAPLPHPQSILRAGIQGPDVGSTTITNRIIIRQEQPWHPGSLLFAQFIDSLPAPTRNIRDWVSTQREQPWHPQSRFHVHFVDMVSPIRRTILTRQELPSHPDSRLFPGVRPNNVGVGITNYIITRQEQPFQALWPRPPLVSGIRIPAGFVHAYIL